MAGSPAICTPVLPQSNLADLVILDLCDKRLILCEEVDLLTEKQAKAFEAGVPTARVIRLRGTHYIFLSEEAAVLHEMRYFLTGLR
jgi:hypothetical protein